MSKRSKKKAYRKPSSNNLGPVKSFKMSKESPMATTEKSMNPGKAYLNNDELSARYAYVKSDLKNIAFIAIPMILALFIASWLIKF